MCLVRFAPLEKNQCFHYVHRGFLSFFLQFHSLCELHLRGNRLFGRLSSALAMKSYLAYASGAGGCITALWNIIFFFFLKLNFDLSVLYLVRTVKQRFYFLNLINCLAKYIELLLWSRMFTVFHEEIGKNFCYGDASLASLSHDTPKVNS